MILSVYHPVVVYPKDHEYDRDSKMYALFSSRPEGLEIVCSPTKNLSDLASKLEGNYALSYSSLCSVLKIDGIEYLVQAFNHPEKVDLENLLKK
jgi:hypothetical protein